MEKEICLRGVRTNNLKNISLKIPLKQFTVITGVSGSGKSSLAFNTLYAEGQRRYVESLSTYTRQFLEKMAKPDLDSIENIPPAIALEQKNHINNSRSTVATMSEIYDYIRLLFAKTGETFCYQCGKKVQADTSLSVAQNLGEKEVGSRFYVLSILGTENWELTRKALLKAGFERVVTVTKNSTEVAEISSLEKLPSKLAGLYLVIDRMVLESEKREQIAKDARLMDALEQGFNHGLGKLALAFVDKNPDKPWSFEFFSDKFRCDTCNIDYRTPEPQLFSFNSPLGACSGCSGFGFNLELDEDLVVPDKRKTLKNGAVDPLTKPAYQDWHHDLIKFCEKKGIAVGKRYEDLSASERKLIWEGDGSKKGFQGIQGCFEELKGWRYKLYVRVFIRRYQSQRICTQCNGARLKKETLSVKVGGLNIGEILSMSIETAHRFFHEKFKPTPHQAKIAKDILNQIQGRLRFLADVGIGYLTLNRLGKTLSGGECQRINLATQLGNSLCSTLYVLDEPSIGLHPADTEKLISLMHRLRDHGNTLVVVEHDLDVISAADHVVELGPWAGYRGGEVVAAGTLSKIKEDKGCLTAKYLTNTFTIPKPTKRRAPTEKALKITGACENNLQDLTVEFPLNLLIAVTGLSGSGKTTLVHRILYNALARLFHRENLPVGKFYRLYGADYLSDAVLLDQKPIGKSSRSNPATYLKIWEDVRKIYSNQSLSVRRGYGPEYFSFNVDAGRCPVCKGEGEVTLDMHFMSEIKLPCEECDGKKFKKTILEVEYHGKNVDQILRTTVDECIDIFRSHPSITSKLQTLKKVGLGYLQLGQSSTTLSGGECQRLKIASVLESRASSNVLYVFDEPTTGLHIDDVKKLAEVMQDLVDRKNTVILIEHNLDMIAQADWIIDLGPGGGEHGGKLVATGSPEEVAQSTNSLTGHHLKRMSSGS